MRRSRGGEAGPVFTRRADLMLRGLLSPIRMGEVERDLMRARLRSRGVRGGDESSEEESPDQ